EKACRPGGAPSGVGPLGERGVGLAAVEGGDRAGGAQGWPGRNDAARARREPLPRERGELVECHGAGSRSSASDRSEGSRRAVPLWISSTTAAITAPALSRITRSAWASSGVGSRFTIASVAPACLAWTGMYAAG